MADPLWIELDGAVNVRDLGGLMAADGPIRAGRLIRSDNLQGLTPADVRLLVDGHGVRAVADLRSTVEVVSEGPGPLTREPSVRIESFSLFPESGERTDVLAVEEDDAIARAAATPDGTAPKEMPWEERDRLHGKLTVAQTYVRYLLDRPDSIVAALRLIARADGATIVHCAAGKDRTGVVVAIALGSVGVDRDEIVTDYVRTGERIERVLARMNKTETYSSEVVAAQARRVAPQAASMAEFLGEIDRQFGGVGGWLETQAWTEQDQAALHHALIGPR
jgi:protein-tyrosine phosphatase